MTTFVNPAVQKFVATLGDELLLAQVLIRRHGRGFALRHVADRARADAELRVVSVAGLRELAQVTETGAFRSLKSAPNLRQGWRTGVADDLELETALNHLYPGALADWFAAQSDAPPVTHYREFTGRQTGMYRITTMLNDEQAARMIRACCHTRFCLKRRLWTVGSLAADTASEKSMIPCLEACAVLLEFARKAARLEQEDRVPFAVGAGDLETIEAALHAALERGADGVREANFGVATNPRRLQWVLEKLQCLLAATRAKSEEK